MNNEEILKVVESEFDPLRTCIITGVGKTICRIKDEDFKEKISQTLKYLDCEAYTDSCRTSFRIFAEHLFKTLKEQ